MALNEFIYIRTNEWCELHNIYKVGKTNNLPVRHRQYKTYEPKIGQFIIAYQILNYNSEIIEKKLHKKFKKKNLHFYVLNSGIEYFKKEIIDLIEPILNKMNVEYNIINNEQIKELIDDYNEKYPEYLDSDSESDSESNEEFIASISDTSSTEIINDLSSEEEPIIISKIIIKPILHQQEIIDIVETFYSENNIGKIIWACGLGKALLSILIVKKMNFNKILIGVPSSYLQLQFKKEILKIFQNKDNILLVGSNSDESHKYIKSHSELTYLSSNTTNKTIIKYFLEKVSDEPLFIITTFKSSHLLDSSEFEFDFKIGDEAHHLVCYENSKNLKIKETVDGKTDQDICNVSFQRFHTINSKKTLFMTATEKNYDLNGLVENVYNMNDELIFGNYIGGKEKIKTISWAIENKKICDYNILIIKNTEEEILEYMENVGILNNKYYELFMSAYLAFSCISKYSDLSHILIYSNTKNHASWIEYFLNILSKNSSLMDSLNLNKEDFYIKTLHSENINKKTLNTEIEKFKNSKYGVISCVYIFGEGFDLPKLNGVIFGENMNSDIRIVQSAMRPNRKDTDNPDKMAYIIIPYIDDKEIFDLENWKTKKPNFDKVRKIVARIRNVDEHIEQKLKLLKIPPKSPSKPDIPIPDKIELFEDLDELNKIKIRLRKSKSLICEKSIEEEEYELFKEHIKKFNFKNKNEFLDAFKTKSLLLENIFENPNLIKDPIKYFKNNHLWTNFYHILNVDTSKYLKLDEWRKFCFDNKINIDNYIEMSTSEEFKDFIPEYPEDYYPEFTTFYLELNYDSFIIFE